LARKESQDLFQLRRQYTVTIGVLAVGIEDTFTCCFALAVEWLEVGERLFECLLEYRGSSAE
jgi:hypothetical protein